MLVPSESSTCIIIDGHALVQALWKPNSAKTFGDYADLYAAKVKSFITAECTRVDVVFDQYLKHSIKNRTREKRTGKNSRSVRRIVDSRDVPLPCNWKKFLALPENKSNLAEFLSDELIRQAVSFGSCELITAGGFTDTDTAKSSIGRDMCKLKASHEEADTRMILHAIDAKQEGYDRLVVLCRDTDVLILLLHFVPHLSEEIWMQAGTAKTATQYWRS